MVQLGCEIKAISAQLGIDWLAWANLGKNVGFLKLSWVKNIIVTKIYLGELRFQYE